MFKDLRKKALAMDKEEALKLMEDGEYAVVSVIGADGYPYGFPMSYALLDGQIYFHGAKAGHKMDCLRHSDKVSVTVIGATELLPERLDTNYESVVIFGRAAEVTDEEKKLALLALVAKYSPLYVEKGQKSLEEEFERTTVVGIKIEHMTGKRRWGDQR